LSINGETMGGIGGTELTRESHGVGQAASQIRRLLNELSMSINGLEDVLNEAGRRYHITDAELLRRQNLVATLKGRKDDLTSRFSRGADNDPMAAGGRAQLLSSGDARAGRYEEDQTTRGLDSQGIMQHHDQIMREQDKGLDILQQSIARQKQLGLTIGNELDDQNGALPSMMDP
jgi:regulator of vacuolar morphogenesis